MNLDSYKTSTPPEENYSDEVYSHTAEYYFDSATLFLKISNMGRILSAKAIYHDEMLDRDVLLGAYMLIYYMDEQLDAARKENNIYEMYDLADSFYGETSSGDFNYDKLLALSRPVHTLEEVSGILGDSINRLRHCL